jgi:hypothetical protein
MLILFVFYSYAKNTASLKSERREMLALFSLTSSEDKIEDACDGRAEKRSA